MSKMPYIAYLAENGMLKELTEEVGSTQVAQGFINAVEEIRENANNPAYKNLNKIQDKAVNIGKKNRKL
jgi:hypothetical protein|tara:strand:- start:4322 stop:4528 length:207 start_codon:yes stop_codon:yes gene_type:complete